MSSDEVPQFYDEFQLRFVVFQLQLQVDLIEVGDSDKINLRAVRQKLRQVELNNLNQNKSLIKPLIK